MKVLGPYAFRDCRLLRWVEFPRYLKQIPPRCFQNAGLDSVAIPRSVMSIGEGAFYGCRRLEDVRIENIGLVRIEKCAFG